MCNLVRPRQGNRYRKSFLFFEADTVASSGPADGEGGPTRVTESPLPPMKVARGFKAASHVGCPQGFPERSERTALPIDFSGMLTGRIDPDS